MMGEKLIELFLRKEHAEGAYTSIKNETNLLRFSWINKFDRLTKKYTIVVSAAQNMWEIDVVCLDSLLNFLFSCTNYTNTSCYLQCNMQMMITWNEPDSIMRLENQPNYGVACWQIGTTLSIFIPQKKKPCDNTFF